MKTRTFIKVTIISIFMAIAVVVTIAIVNNGDIKGRGDNADTYSDNTEPLQNNNSNSCGEEIESINEEMSGRVEEQKEPLNIPVWTTDRVNFRSAPGIDSDIIEKLSRRTKAMLLYDLGEWDEVEINGRHGYIASEYVSFEEPITNGFIVCIDPGHQRHGDSAPEPNGPGSSTTKARVTQGTTGRTTGIPEYELTLDISLQLKKELESRGYTVVMTRETHDVNISNMERARFATDMGADITVRIHANGADSSSVNGALAMVPTASNPFVSSLSSESNRLGKEVLNAYCASTGMQNLGVQGYDNMTGINFCTMPVIILEMGFMTNSSDDVNMQDKFYQNNMVMGIADGIDNYF